MAVESCRADARADGPGPGSEALLFIVARLSFCATGVAILFPDLTDEGVPVNEFAGSGEANLAIDVSRLADSGLGEEERKERGIELGICTELDLREDGTSSLLSIATVRSVCYTPGEAGYLSWILK